jgi:hypothetical protein
LILEEFALIWILLFVSYISISRFIKEACQNFTNSSDINSDIGTKFVKIKIQVPVICKKIKPELVSHSDYGLNFR